MCTRQPGEFPVRLPANSASAYPLHFWSFVTTKHIHLPPQDPRNIELLWLSSILRLKNGQQEHSLNSNIRGVKRPRMTNALGTGLPWNWNHMIILWSRGPGLCQSVAVVARLHTVAKETVPSLSALVSTKNTSSQVVNTGIHSYERIHGEKSKGTLVVSMPP